MYDDKKMDQVKIFAAFDFLENGFDVVYGVFTIGSTEKLKKQFQDYKWSETTIQSPALLEMLRNYKQDTIPVTFTLTPNYIYVSEIDGKEVQPEFMVKEIVDEVEVNLPFM
jgi:hypothetical protein